MVNAMSEGIAHETVGTEAPGHRGRRPWRRADFIKAFVVTALFFLMLASSLANGGDPFIAAAIATFWSALVALVWELSARALARHRR
jgi:hypothetical protein